VHIALALLGIAGGLPSAVHGQATDYTALSLEELATVPISTLGRKETTVLDTPAAAYVITSDDLHRSGALDLAEALYLVPGMQVQRTDSFNYTISIRGFDDATSNMLLVMMGARCTVRLSPAPTGTTRR